MGTGDTLNEIPQIEKHVVDIQVNKSCARASSDNWFYIAADMYTGEMELEGARKHSEARGFSKDILLYFNTTQRTCLRKGWTKQVLNSVVTADT